MHMEREKVWMNFDSRLLVLDLSAGHVWTNQNMSQNLMRIAASFIYHVQCLLFHYYLIYAQ